MGSDTLGFSTSSATAADLMDLCIQGKDLLKDRQEYLDIILRLPYVDNDNLKAVEVFERWKRYQISLDTAEV